MQSKNYSDFNLINSFLHLCYLPYASTEVLDPIIQDPKNFSAQKKKRSLETEKILISEGCDLLKKTIFSLIPPQKRLHVVPLSGGLDSRAILAHLLDAGLKDDILAVSFGIPGTHDFEIGRIVAKYAGVRHYEINLNQEPVTLKNLVQTCLEGGAWTGLIPSYYNRIASSLFGTNALFWSGYIGGPIGGSHYKPGYEKLNWDQALKLFWGNNRAETNQAVHANDG